MFSVSAEQSSTLPTPLLELAQSLPNFFFKSPAITTATSLDSSSTPNVSTADQTSAMNHTTLTNALTVLNTFASSFPKNGFHLPSMHSTSNIKQLTSSTDSNTVKTEPITTSTTITEIDPSILI
ncbi:unnamed protein product [Schistosoma curassoni]|uniref:Uncharacterized protein n=1 Tax=Schistosoma curassoni TaxID=6186 RepID=A0A3P8GVB6_9TREM|nr:unnamed protein product [Schistosoma curassoni]